MKLHSSAPRVVAVVSAIVLAAGLGACSGNTDTPGPEEPGNGVYLPDGITVEDVEAAQAEGEINYYTTSAEEAERVIAAAFEARYGIRVNIQRASSGALYERITAEAGAGQDIFDVVTFADPVLANEVADQGLFASLDDLGLVPDEGTFHDWAVDPAGYWIAVNAPVAAIFYNNQLVNDEDAPKTWADLLDPQWGDGKIAIMDAQPGGSPWQTQYMFRKLYGIEYWEDFAAQQPGLYPSSAAAVQAVETGERLVGTVVDAAVVPKLGPGAVLSLVIPEDGIFPMPYPQAVSAKAPNAAAAKLFTAWYKSPEGQQALLDIRGAYPARVDVAIEGRPALNDLPASSIFDADWRELADEAFTEAWRSDWVRIFRP